MTAVMRYILIVTAVIRYTCNDDSGNTLHLSLAIVTAAVRYI